MEQVLNNYRYSHTQSKLPFNINSRAPSYYLDLFVADRHYTNIFLNISDIMEPHICKLPL